MEECRSKELVHKCNSDPGGKKENSQPRLRSSSTSRKCVLTLDGYSYVIGKYWITHPQ